jgi:hypothetical protein
MASLKPVIHGRDHEPGGSDPIHFPEGMVLGGGSLEGAIITPGHLEGWWRLGEAGPFPSAAVYTPNWLLDSSGLGRHGEAINANIPHTAVLYGPGDPHLPTQHIDGALTLGDPTLNDGGIRFNFNQYQWTSWGEQLCVSLPTRFPETLWTNGSGAGASLVCWVQYIPPSETQNDISNVTASDPVFYLLGDLQHVYGVSTTGSHLGFTPATGVLTWDTTMGGANTWASSAGLIAHRWYHFAMTLGKVGAVYTRTFYLNGNVVATLTGNAAAVVLAGDSSSVTLTLGGANLDDLRFSHGAGCLDELEIYSKALTLAEVQNIYNATVLAEGDTYAVTTIGTGPAGTPGTLHSELPGGADAPAGYVATADGSGGTTYATPKTKVWLNGV